MEEKEEKKKEPRRNALTIGIGSQETADRFLAVRNGTYAVTYEEIVKILLDNYENPPQDDGSAATIAKLKQRIEELEQDNLGYRSEEDNYKHQISELEAKLDTARNEANANAESAMGDQLQLEELRKRTEGAIVLKPNPVTGYFLNEMAEKEGTDPGKILERLFFDDLQNPRANNLPYTVSPSRIREVMEELKKTE